MTLAYCNVSSLNEVFYTNKQLRNEYNRYFSDSDSKKSNSLSFLLLNLIAHQVPLDILNTLHYNQFGKPYFYGSNISFSLSHSREMLACAISFSSDIGVDLEFRDDHFDVEDFRSIFSTEEMDLIRSRHLFYKLWTRKECLIKARGLNLDINMKGICTLQDTLNYENRTWYFENINVIPGYEISICNTIKEKCNVMDYKLLPFLK